MTTASVEAALIALFQHLGINQAHIVVGQMVSTDWLSFTARHPERIASLTLVSPRLRPQLRAMAARLLVVTGDQGVPAERARQLLATVPEATLRTLADYTCLPWSDVAADRSAEIVTAMLDFLNRMGRGHSIAALALPEQEGEFAGISYRVRGAGPPLVLMPLDLAPSQWEPLIPQLSAHYCTITLGGPALGVVSLLEGRGRSGYLGVVRTLLDAVRVQPEEKILEVGCGSGVVLRELARRTAGANPIIGIDMNAFLRREAMSLAAREGLADRIIVQEGRAEALPLERNSVDIALSCTVMEEGDADLMLTELVRVTRPGGRVGAIVRAMDMPRWTNLPLSPALRSKTDQPGFFGDVTAGGCADASLYHRFHAAGLTELTCFPQLVAITPTFEPSRLADMEQRLLTTLTAEEAAEWREAVAPAKAAGTFFLASPHHCAVG